MSSGSYFTIYRKLKNDIASKDVIDSIRNEYFLSTKKGLFENTGKSDDELKTDIPVLMDLSFKSELSEHSDENFIFYDSNGVKHIKLLEFHFCSTFSCLKEYWSMNAYSFKDASRLVSKSEVEKILQAINYVLSEKYDKKFEEILSNEYVEVFGTEYSPFINRFKKSSTPIYIDREGHNYKITKGDYGFDVEIAENDADAKWNLNHVKACLEAFMYAECYSWRNEELVLEYSAY